MVTLQITNGPTIQVTYQAAMNAQQVLEAAYLMAAPAGSFTYTLQYFGRYGYLVNMINETFESFISGARPFFYWEFLINGNIATKGIDQTEIHDGDTVTFTFIPYTAATPEQSTTHIKYKLKSLPA